MEISAEWYDVRKKFLHGYLFNATSWTGRMIDAIERAEDFAEDEAQWLYKLYGSNPPDDLFYILETLRKELEKENERLLNGTSIKGDGRAHAYYGIITSRKELVLRAARVWKNSLARCWFFDSYRGWDFLSDEEAYEWAVSASKEERDGLLVLGRFHSHGWFGCAKDKTKAAVYFKKAMELGCYISMNYYANSAFKKADPERYFWLAKAAGKDVKPKVFLYNVISLIEPAGDIYLPLKSKLGANISNKIIFQMGFVNVKAMEKYLEEHKQRLARGRFKKDDFCEKALRCVKKARQMHLEWCYAARRAVETWTLIGRRLGLYKDIIRIISREIWDARSDADYIISAEKGN